MKIINIITQMEAGGAQGAAVRMTKKLNTLGHESEVWFLHCKRPVYIDEKNVRVFHHKKATSIHLVFIFLKLIVALIKEKPDAVICYTHYANIIGATAAYIAGIKKRVVSQRNPSFSYPYLAKVLDKMLGSTKVYTANICVSDHVNQSFSTYPKSYRKKISVIYNGIDFGSSSMTQVHARKKYGLPENGFLLITTGRLSYQKNHDFLLDLVQKLDHEVYLAIAGEGELREEIEDKIHKVGLQNRVFLLGELSPAAVAEFLSTGDVFVFPSRFEAFGFSLVEAMSSGLPVIVNDIPALKFIVDNQDIVIATDRLNEWVSTIQELKTDQAQREKLAAKSKVRSSFFALDKMVNSYLRLCSDESN